MCGITGIVRFDDQPVDLTVLARMSRRLAHRGPDGVGYLGWRAGPVSGPMAEADALGSSTVALAHRRLAIIDLSPAGAQPMVSADGRYAIAFNGEIYNHVELRAELTRRGHGFRSRSDTEALLAAWQAWGPAALGRFEGMFAFAVLDTVARRLTLVRDPLGIKPLYTARTAGGLAFASETKALAELPDWRPRLDPARLYRYLRFSQTDHGGGSLLANVRQIPAAHYVEVDLARGAVTEPVRYWRPQPEPLEQITDDEAATRLGELFHNSVRAHLRSDVPVGVALSGGIDSTALAVAARAALGPRAELHAFGFVADEPRLSEEHWIDLAAAATGAIVHKTRPGAAELVRDIEDLVDAQDEPFGSPSIFAQRHVFAAARAAGIKVVLSGQGADELLAGYRTYLAARWASLVLAGDWRGACRLGAAIGRLPDGGFAGQLVRLGAHLAPRGLAALGRAVTGESLVPAWLDGRWFRERGVEPAPLWQRRSPEVLRDQLLETLRETNLPALLRYEDRNSMAAGVESRVPFLTPRLVNFLLGLPERCLIDEQGTTKAVFRRALRGQVPDAILDRRDKIGFTAPTAAWLRAAGPWVDRLWQSDAARRLEPLRLDVVRRQWQAFMAGRRPLPAACWRWINVLVWLDRHGVACA